MSSIRALVAASMVLSSGCATISPEDNFKRGLDFYVGRDVTNEPSYSFVDPGDALEEKVLSNGNIERIYLREIPDGRCRYALELTKEDVVVGWHVVEDQGGCLSVP